MLFHMAEYCDTPESKDRSNREYKECLHERAIPRLLDHDHRREEVGAILMRPANRTSYCLRPSPSLERLEPVMNPLVNHVSITRPCLERLSSLRARRSLSRGALKPASEGRVKTSQCLGPFLSLFVTSVKGIVLVGPRIRDGCRPGSLGSAAVREWALRKLVAAWPSQAERARPVGVCLPYGFASLSGSSFACSLGLSASFVALSFKR